MAMFIYVRKFLLVMAEITTVKVSEKGQIALPVKTRNRMLIKQGDTLILIEEKDKLLLKKTDEIARQSYSEFGFLLKHSEAVAKKLWGSKSDDVWDTI